MQPRRNHITQILNVPSRRLRCENSRLTLSRRSFTRTLNANETSKELRCYMERWHIATATGICTSSNRQRAFSTTNTTSTPKDELKGVGKPPESTSQAHAHPALPASNLMNEIIRSPSNLKSQRHHPIPARSKIPHSQHVDVIMRDVEVGRLSYADVTSILAEAFERSRVSKQRATNIIDINYVEQLVHRLVQEVNYWHIDKVVVNKNDNQESTKIQTSHVIRSLGTIWHYIILGSAHLPVVSNNASEQPFMTTGRLLMNMLQLHHMYPMIHPPPTPTLYNAWLHSCVTCSSVTDDALIMAEAILRNLEGNMDFGKDDKSRQSNEDKFHILPPPVSIPKPTKGMYNHVIFIHANRAKTVYGAAVQAEDLLMRMSKVGVHPATDTFNRVLKAWSECPEKEGGNRAADILHMMLTLSKDSSKITYGNEIAPDEVSFGTVITAFAKRGEPEACQLILEEAVAYFASDLQRSNRMNALNQCWNTTLSGWARSGRPDVPERIEALLNDGIMIHDRRYKLVPTKSTYVACIEAHLKSDRPDRIVKAERFLHLMIESMRNAEDKKIPGKFNVEDVVVTTREFDTLINAWFRSLEEFENIGVNKVTGIHPIGYTSTKASSLLLQMLKLEKEGYRTCIPSSGSFHMCIESLCRTAGACITAAKNVRKVIPKTKGEDGRNESLQVAQEYKSSMGRHAMLAADKALEILVMAEDRKLSTDSSYATVVQLLCRIHEPRYAYIATEVLQRYEQKTDELNLNWQKEKVWIYLYVVNALNNNVGTLHAAESALAILRRIPKHGKRAIDKNKLWVYNGVIHAFLKHPGERTCVVAMELFQELISEPNKNPTSNNSITVDFCERVLWVLADSGTKQSAGDAFDVLNSILDLHSAKKIGFEPSVSCFNACIHALTAARDLKYTIHSVQLLKDLVTKYESSIISKLPTRIAFDLVIRNCNEMSDKMYMSDEMLQYAKDVTLLAEKYASADTNHQTA